MAVVVMGKPGSGKSSVAKEVATQLGWQYISTGDLARQLKDSGDWEQFGGFAPEEEMREAFITAVRNAGNDVVIDGMPRKPEQVPFIYDLFCDLSFFLIDIPNKTAKERLYQRGRSDDTIGTIDQRLRNYKKYTDKAVGLIELNGNITKIDGHRRVEDIVALIVNRTI